MTEQPDPAPQSKAIAESFRVITPLFLQNQARMNKNVAPFFILVLITLFTVYDFHLGPSMEVGDDLILFSGVQPAQIAFASDTAISQGIKIYKPRRFAIVALSIALWVMFVRFGFLYYQGIDLKIKMKDVINKEADTDIQKMYRFAIKDAYFVDALLIFFTSKSEEVDVTGTIRGWKRFIAGAVILAFLIFIIIGQYLTIAATTSVLVPFAFVLLIFYALFYLLFWHKLRYLKNNHSTTNEETGHVVIYGLFIAAICMSITLNFYAMIQYSGRAAESNGKVAFANKIPYEYALHPNPINYQIDNVFPTKYEKTLLDNKQEILNVKQKDPND